MKFKILCLLACLLTCMANAENQLKFKQTGIASWYGKKFHNRRTASGERYVLHGMTAAHRTLPMGTYVRVTNLRNGRQVVVKINDRGPFHSKRIIDLSNAAAEKLGISHKYIPFVKIEVVPKP